MSNASAELQRRSVHNYQARALLEKNPQWRAAAGPAQRQRLMGGMFARTVAAALLRGTRALGHRWRRGLPG
eukprot:9310309-Lingulodinium_polyedra.AAC.1